MRFNLVDQITEVVPGKRLSAKKYLTLGEEYLADHFPTFPVMPGVLQVQALVEVSSWLWRVTSDFAHSVIVLREVRGAKYGMFVEPGRCFDMQSELVRVEESGLALFKVKGHVEGTQALSAQLLLAAYNIPDATDATRQVDAELIVMLRRKYTFLIGNRLGEISASPVAG